MKNHRGVCRWLLLQFQLKIFAFSFLKDFLRINRKLHQKSIQKGFRHTLNLRKMHWKYRETTVHQHPQLKFVVYPQETHYDSIQNHCTIVSIFYPLQSFGYQSRLISSNLCMLSLLGLNYVGYERDTNSPCINTYPHKFFTKVLIISVLQLVSSVQNKILIFHTMISI